jgi:flagellar biosynthetic protein FliP
MKLLIGSLQNRSPLEGEQAQASASSLKPWGVRLPPTLTLPLKGGGNIFEKLLRYKKTLALVFLGLFAFTASAAAQSLNIDLGGGAGAGTGVTERAIQLIALLTVLSLAPSILVMVTSFTRIVVVLSILRTALGAGTAPPNTVIVSLALFLTAFIMAPTFKEAYTVGVQPYVAGTVQLQDAFMRGAAPFKTFMLKHTRDKDLALFLDMSAKPRPASAADVELQVVIPAFMISELRRAFEIAFLLYLPFVVIDLVVASVLMAMGMMMLPPVAVSLPFKLIFFVLVDGWNLVAGSLIKGFM